MREIKEITLPNYQAQIIFGKHDENLRFLENILDVELFGRGNVLKIKGSKENIEKAIRIIEQLKEKLKEKDVITQKDIIGLLDSKNKKEKEKEKEDVRIKIGSKKDFVVPKTPKQRTYIQYIRKYDLVIGIGPAGTGKTYLAVACGIEALKSGNFQRLILTRPALEAGERLGFLPGDLEEKIRPYLQPVYDALFDMLKYEELKRWQEKKIIEIVPLAYMRGRTLSKSFIILDEAQNTTIEQMKMFLTRLGVDSKAVITGDITQIDLPLTPKTSGLVEIQEILKGIKGVKFIYFTQKDVVRHHLVKKIINAYERHYREKISRISDKESSEETKDK
ncbi:MAG: hypothetical protein DRP67_00235 [Candidatus Omnitrophota bacterium]|nr:MAG: hypothetical protein DRP67_00235 [Candidatus Omnitrophota bacterium]